MSASSYGVYLPLGNAVRLFIFLDPALARRPVLDEASGADGSNCVLHEKITRIGQGDGRLE